MISRMFSRKEPEPVWSLVRSPVWSPAPCGLPYGLFRMMSSVNAKSCLGSSAAKGVIRFGRQHYQHSSKTDAGSMCAESDVPRTHKGLQLGFNHWLWSHCRSEHGPVEPTTGMAIRSLPHGIPCGRWAVYRIRNTLSGLFHVSFLHIRHGL